MNFDDKHYGKHIELSNDNLTAKRISGFNNGLIVSSQVLKKGQLFQVSLFYASIYVYLDLKLISLIYLCSVFFSTLRSRSVRSTQNGMDRFRLVFSKYPLEKDSTFHGLLIN